MFSDRQNYQTIMFDNKVLIRINKSKLSYFYSKWNFNKNINCDEIFRFNDNFSNKYNDGKPIPLDKEDFLKWFEENREKMKELNITKEELLDFFSFDNKKEIELK